MYSIFVQIASYRDPELVPTLHNLLDNAKYPEQLTICVAHQHSAEDEWDNLNDFKNDSRFIIIDIPHTEAQGTCWARHQIQRHYTNQMFTLHLDSHHRFIKDWDAECIDMFFSLRKKGVTRPLITSYLPSYLPHTENEDKEDVPWSMVFDRFTPKGMLFFKPHYMEDNATEPIPARFYSGHFAFTIGEICREVPHDPYLYFHGEEISIAVRAYTWGYDLFHPHKIIAWHEYTRQGRDKHWDDHTEWSKRDESSQNRVRSLLQVDNQQCTSCAKKALKGYDFGPVRTLEQYENYAGIKFKNRTVQQSALDNKNPGNNQDPFLSLFRYKIQLNKSQLSCDDYSFVAVIYEDENGVLINRKDLQEKEASTWKYKEAIEIDSEFIGKTPQKYIVWPYSKSKGWVDRIESIIL